MARTARRATSAYRALGTAGVTAIVITQQYRTQRTAAPLAGALGLTPVAVPIDGAKPREHAQAVAEAVRRTTQLARST